MGNQKEVVQFILNGFFLWVPLPAPSYVDIFHEIRQLMTAFLELQENELITHEIRHCSDGKMCTVLTMSVVASLLYKLLTKWDISHIIKEVKHANDQ